MKRFVILFVLFVEIHSKSEFDDVWKTLKQNYKTKFASAKEEEYRRGICETNFANIKKHNAQADMGKSTYKVGVNQFCILTEQEFKQKWLSGVKVPTNGSVSQKQQNNEFRSQRVARQTPPASLDLSTTGGVGPIRDQGQCGSPWAFSALAPLEYAYWRRTGQFLDFSEQQLVDCVYGSMGGCQGGWMPTAFDYIKKNGGIGLEFQYPYTAKNGVCKGSSIPKFVTLGQPTYVQVSNDDKSIKNALANVGVLAVCVDAAGWGSYKIGIYQDGRMASISPTCSHAVSLVGYGTENGIPFYKIRNSWNTWWGEKGYMRMDARRHTNGNTYSGIMLNYVYYPVLA